jgi:hypothetical protein
MEEQNVTMSQSANPAHFWEMKYKQAEAKITRIQSAFKSYKNVEAKIAERRLETAIKLEKECSPENIQGERETNEILTNEIEAKDALINDCLMALMEIKTFVGFGVVDSIKVNEIATKAIEAIKAGF